jgi:hypothetical protein
MNNGNQSEPFKRLNFFTGFFTTADDWNEGEQYHLDKRRLHNRGLHTPGIIPIVAGEPGSLAVLPAEGLRIRVEPGAVLDGTGNLIYLHNAWEQEIDKPVLPEDPAGPPLAHTRYVTIRFGEVFTDPIVNAQDPDYSGHARRTELPQVEVRDVEPDNHEWMELARITVYSNTVEIAPEDIDVSHVKHAGAVDPNKDKQVQEIHSELERIEKDLVQVDEYHELQRLLVLRRLHRPGVIANEDEWLKVDEVDGATAPAVQVLPGAALDAAGHLLQVAQPVQISIERPIDWPDDTHRLVYITIEHPGAGEDHKTVAPLLRALYTEPSDLQVELGRIRLTRDATQISRPLDPHHPQVNEIDLRHVQTAGSVDLLKDRLFAAVRERIERAHEYHLQKVRRHNRGVHTPGVLHGVGDEFKVTALGGLTVRVEAGAAVDGEGNEIYLAEAHPLTIARSAAARRVYIAVRHRDSFAHYLSDLEKPFMGGFSTAVIVESESAPDNRTLLELAHIDLPADAETIDQEEIDTRKKPWSGSIGVAPEYLPLELQKRIRLQMETKRENFARLASRFPSPSVDDVRAAALHIQMSIATLRPDQALALFNAIAQVELDVKQELARRYPPLVWQAEFIGYSEAVAALLEALRQRQSIEALLNFQEQVAIAALEVAEVVLQPPIAHAGPDQGVETSEPMAKVMLDGSRSRAAQGHQIMRYAWENITAGTTLIETDQAQAEVTLPLGVHVLRLIVEDNAYQRSEPDVVVIRVEPTAISITRIDPEQGWRGATFDAVIWGKNLQRATAVKVYHEGKEDKRIHVAIRAGGNAEQLLVTFKISGLAALGPRVVEVVTPHGAATAPFAIVPHEQPVILGITPLWATPGLLPSMPLRVEGDHLEQAGKITFLRGETADPALQTIIRRADADYIDADLSISVNAEFGARRLTVTTPAGTTESPPTVYLTVVPGFLQVDIILLTIATALIYLISGFPNTVPVFIGVSYLVLLAGLYAPTSWLLPDLRPMMRWGLLIYALVIIVIWLVSLPAVTFTPPLVYVTKAIEVLLVLLLFAESRQP